MDADTDKLLLYTVVFEAQVILGCRLLPKAPALDAHTTLGCRLLPNAPALEAQALIGTVVTFRRLDALHVVLEAHALIGTVVALRRLDALTTALEAQALIGAVVAFRRLESLPAALDAQVLIGTVVAFRRLDALTTELDAQVLIGAVVTFRRLDALTMAFEAQEINVFTVVNPVVTPVPPNATANVPEVMFVAFNVVKPDPLPVIVPGVVILDAVNNPVTVIPVLLIRHCCTPAAENPIAVALDRNIPVVELVFQL